MANDIMELKRVKQLTELRALVGFLGEKRQFNWWDTDFLSPTGLEFLAINFPRSTFAAGCNSIVEAARRLHDERIGKGGVYHLFRLPASLEETVHQEIMKLPTEKLAEDVKNSEAAMESLKAVAQDITRGVEGPVLVGPAAELTDPKILGKLAGHYLAAFRDGRKNFPYFVETGENG